MEDFLIVNLYWARKESAITESDLKYGRILRSLSFSVLSSREDAEECVNDTYLAAWNAMPTERPDYLGAFLSKITRRISIDRYRAAHRKKRGGLSGVMAELSECIPSSESVEADYENGRLADALNQFLASLPTEKRAIFLRRYFYSQPIGVIAETL
ncbi:MAG: sigma-70 family RNA polymerase sigma factor, partial [Clostridia bacterium]|nr:sigma-70 family RNA polymerase sigma factor [Clostridia bacterium]